MRCWTSSSSSGAGRSLAAGSFAAITAGLIAALIALAPNAGAADQRLRSARSDVSAPSVAGEVSAATVDPIERLAARAGRSGDLRLRILFSRPGFRRVDDDPALALGALIDAARGSTDPLVLQLLLERCREQPETDGCKVNDLAKRWTVADAQDVVPWIELATVLGDASDEAGAADAWAGAARASTFRDATGAVARLVFAQFPRDDDPRVRYAEATAAIGVAAAVPMPWGMDVKRGCKPIERRAACTHVADTMFRDSDSLFGVQVARSLTELTQQPAWIRDSRRQSEEALQWVLARTLGDLDADVVAGADPQALAEIDRRLERLIAFGDVRVARDALRAQRLTDADAARNYAVDMTALMDRLRPH